MVETIEIAIEALPPVDEHWTLVDAGPERVWEALVATLPHRFGGRAASRVADALGCAQTERRGETDRIGSTLPGFIVARSVRPAALALLGQHRFSRYALVFRIDDLGGGRSRLGAETRAEFPGGRGRVYRALVVGSRGHVLVVNRILRAVRRRAESGTL